MTKKILIQTALSLEFSAVQSFLKNVQPVVHPETSSIYSKGTYITNNTNYEVLIVETGPGNIRAADETGRAIAFFKPDYLFFVGVAGGIKDVKLGDVVVSTKVIGYEMGKEDSTFKPRLDTVPASYLLEQIAKHLQRENKWVEKITELNGNAPDAYVQPIAAGEKVVVSNKSVVFSYLKQFCSEAVAVDMEGNGFLVAARPYHAHAIEVRGISDLIENKEEADASGSQPRAAIHAAAFTFAMIDQLSIQQHSYSFDLQSLEFRNKLVDELVQLYPVGPEQDDIWKRAGGDISFLSNSSSRKSQWYNAIEKLAFGGGGKNISLTKLINTIKEDYPNSLNSLFN